MMNVHSIETFGTHEGPGIRFVIFVQGCNYKCLYCHNPDTQPLERQVESQNIPPLNLPLTKGEHVGVKYNVENLVKMIEKNRPYFGTNGGVTISGGEPLLQAKEITELFKELKKRKIQTALDTNGSILNDDVRELLKYTDLVLLDIKQIDPKWHETITGTKISDHNVILNECEESPYSVSGGTGTGKEQKILKQVQYDKKNDDGSHCVPSIRFAGYLESQNIPFWIRYVLVPGYTDQIEYLEQIAHRVGHFKNLERIEILPYHTMGGYKYEELGIEYKLKNILPPTQENIERAKKILEESGKKVLVR